MKSSPPDPVLIPIPIPSQALHEQLAACAQRVSEAKVAAEKIALDLQSHADTEDSIDAEIAAAEQEAGRDHAAYARLLELRGKRDFQPLAWRHLEAEWSAARTQGASLLSEFDSLIQEALITPAHTELKKLVSDAIRPFCFPDDGDAEGAATTLPIFSRLWRLRVEIRFLREGYRNLFNALDKAERLLGSLLAGPIVVAIPLSGDVTVQTDPTRKRRANPESVQPASHDSQPAKRGEPAAA